MATPQHEPLEALLATESVDRFVSERLFDGVPAVFDSQEAHRQWRHRVGDHLDVDPSAVVVVGSGAFGCSMRADKGFRRFSPDSDVDAAVVSHRFFEIAWFHLRRARAQRYGLPAEAQDDLEKWARRRVFSGVIIANVLLPHLPFGPGWQKALGTPEVADPVGGRTINVQIYRDLESLREYQVQSLAKTKTGLESPA